MKGIFSLLFVVLFGVLALAYTFGYVVPPGWMGVRQTKFGPGQGFSEAGLRAGYHWSVPFYTTVHLVPTALQLLHFTREDERGKDAAMFPSLEVQTADRQTVDVDITVIYRFLAEPGTADALERGGPRDLFTLGTTRASWINEVRARAEDQVKRHLGQLSTSEFYNPHFREKQIKEALATVNQRVAPKGIHVEALLLRRYTYRAPEIDNAIFQKNLQEQEQSLNLAASTLAEAQAELEQVAAEWDARIETLRVSGENDARVIRSQGDLFEAERRAEGDLLVAKSRAEVDRTKAGALAQSVGANIYVARELAPLLQTLKGGVVSDIDPYNLNEWTQRLGVQGR